MGKGIDKIKGMHDRPKAKKIAKLFEGFNAVNPSEGHVKLLNAVFSKIFINYSVQFLEILKNLQDPWRNAMRKLAIDAVDRIFNYLQKAVQKPELEDDLFEGEFFVSNLSLILLFRLMHLQETSIKMF